MLLAKKKKEIKYSKKVTILLKIKVTHLCFIERFRESKFVSLIDLETCSFKIPEKILQKIRNTDECTTSVNLGRPIRRKRWFIQMGYFIYHKCLCTWFKRQLKI